MVIYSVCISSLESNLINGLILTGYGLVQMCIKLLGISVNFLV